MDKISMEITFYRAKWATATIAYLCEVIHKLDKKIALRQIKNLIAEKPENKGLALANLRLRWLNWLRDFIYKHNRQEVMAYVAMEMLANTIVAALSETVKQHQAQKN